jgi:peptidoglycan/xylan/chitin deacetylase (PgdA/CDA1 family)
MFKALILLGAVVAVKAQTECVKYATQFTFPLGEYPANWIKPNASVFNTDEFKALNSSINWKAVPNIPPKQMDAKGNFISSSYPASDPDCWWSWSGCTTPKAPGVNPDVSVCPEPNTLGYTFDDGPNCTHNAFYDFLKSNNQTSSLFFIGSNVQNWPKEAQRGLADGHHICVHTWSHSYMTTLTNDEVLAELYYTRKIIKYVVGVTPLCWRPPFGDVDDRVRAIAQQLNLTNMIWDQDSDDWQMTPSGSQPPSYIDGRYQDFATRGMNGTYATHGSILLAHELNNGTMSMAVKWFPQLKKAYKNVIPIASCMNISQPYAETNFTYPTFAQLTGGMSSNGSVNGTLDNPGNPGVNATKGSSGVRSFASAPVGILAAIAALAVL